MAIVCWPLAAKPATELPDLGNTSATVISASEERQLGQEFMRDARGKLRFVEDPELLAYANALGHKMVANSDAATRDFQFFLIQDPSLNAFAVPGGFISVYTGLILASATESELAAVVAHEIAHISQNHMARMLERGKQMSLPATAAMIGAILLGGQAGAAAIATTNAALLEKQLSYSRGFESEADAIGIRILARSGFDPLAMPAFFKQMERRTRVHESIVPEILRTHPLNPNRIAESEARAREYPSPQSIDNRAFYRAKAKIRALFSDRPRDAVRIFANNLSMHNYADESAERFGYATALLRTSQYEEALKQVELLLQTAPHDPSFYLLKGQIVARRGHYLQALKWLAAATSEHPDYGPLAQYYADLLVRTGNAAQAKPLIRSRLKQEPNNPQLWEISARAAGETGETYVAHQSMGEYYYLLGDIEQALAQFETAREHTGDSFYASASIDARIEEIRAENRDKKTQN